MRKIRLITLSALVVFAAAAVIASTASAAFTLSTTECTTPGIPTLCWATNTGEALLELTGSEPFTTTTQGSTLLEVASLELHIVCKVLTTTGGEFSQTAVLTTAGSIKNIVLSFSTCNILPPFETKCKVKEAIVTEKLEGVVTDESPVADITFKPQEGELFTKIVIESKAGQTCPATLTSIIGNVTGTALCLLVEPEVLASTHAIQCLHGETTGLSFAKKPATFQITEKEGEAGEKPGTITAKPTTLTDLWDISLG